MDPVWVAAGAAFAGFGVVLVALAGRPATVDIDGVLDQSNPADLPLDEYEERLQQSIAPRLLGPMAEKLAWLVRGFIPGNASERIKERLVTAGLSERITPEEFMALIAASTIVGSIAFAGLGLAFGWGVVGLVRAAAVGAALGAVLPINWVQRARDKRQTSVKRDLPDVLDLMAISVEAGVGLEGAIEVVTEHFDSPLSNEMGRMLREMELGTGRRVALQNLKHRLDVPEVGNFVLSLVQADALGMPLTRVLQTQADELRARRRQWAREKAARLPVKIVFPLLMFILPALFVVVIGPAVISITENVL